jgi:hypothetical protein
MEVVAAAKLNLNLANVLVVFYLWSEPEEVNVNELLAEVNHLWIVEKSLMAQQQLKTELEHYVRNHFESQVKFLFKQDLDDWLLPTFRVVPRIVGNIDCA